MTIPHILTLNFSGSIIYIRRYKRIAQKIKDCSLPTFWVIVHSYCYFWILCGSYLMDYTIYQHETLRVNSSKYKNVQIVRTIYTFILKVHLNVSWGLSQRHMQMSTCNLLGGWIST